ncbi:MAG: M23 family metallopeptidase, partial [Bacteroidota bacterium]
MRREKFVFNRQNLRYEKVVEPLKYTLLRIFGFFCAAVFTAVLMLMLAHRYFPSPAEKMLIQENDLLRQEIDEVEGQIVELSSILGNLQERDAYAHRMIFGMRPIDKDVWEGGVGGHDAYDNLRDLPRSGEYMASLREKLDKLRHRMDVQSRSLDSISLMANRKEDMLASIPSIKPVRSDKVSRGLLQLSGFGYRIHPIFKTRRMHYGIDFNAPKGTHIQATGKGVVEVAGNRKDGYGNVVIINHGFKTKTV